MRASLLVAFLLSATPLAAQRKVAVSEDATQAWRNAKEIFSSPFRYQKSQWLVVAGILSLGVSAHVLDEPLREFARERRSRVASFVFSVGEFYGSPLGAGLIGGGLYASGLASGDASTRLSGRAVLESVLYAALLTQILKITIGRSRPYARKGARDFNGLSWTNERWSLPSGHATMAFATSSALATRVRKPLASVGFFALATLTAAQRVYDDQHWLSDVVFGAAIGTSVGLAIGKLVNDEAAKSNAPASIEPQPIFAVQLPL
ncbi:MAG: phosphatase PAP2 family protein [Chloroherpetonaceae bacterium]|nr:phosphatase PAP2 family protein [Chloroherpetonaceae bacterium]MDW8438637.1 phosphatase PAP2 family protein [Chloroherpetonaceae bacterium]